MFVTKEASPVYMRVLWIFWQISSAFIMLTHHFTMWKGEPRPSSTKFTSKLRPQYKTKCSALTFSVYQVLNKACGSVLNSNFVLSRLHSGFSKHFLIMEIIKPAPQKTPSDSIRYIWGSFKKKMLRDRARRQASFKGSTEQEELHQSLGWKYDR